MWMPIQEPLTDTSPPGKSGSTAGFQKRDEMSGAPALAPAKALPRPEALCSRSRKPEAEAVEAMARKRVREESARLVMGRGLLVRMGGSDQWPRMVQMAGTWTSADTPVTSPEAVWVGSSAMDVPVTPRK